MDRYDPADLERFASALLQTTGMAAEHADTVAESLVAADLRGHPSHGIHMVPTYVLWIEDGGMDESAAAEVVLDDGPALQVDGHHAIGHPVGRTATELAIERVDDYPVVTVGIRKATHMGRIGWFAEMAAEAGLGFVGFTNMTSGDPVAVAGSAQRRFGTNPLTFGLPAFDALDHPVLLDMATSQVAFGKINVRDTAGVPIDDSWTVTESGDPVPDATTFNEEELGALAPLGGQDAGYKGTGLMLMAELFAATASDSPVTPQPDSRYENSAQFTLFDPLAFTSRSAHEARLVALEDYLDEIDYPEAVSAGGASDYDRAYLPGRPEHETLSERTAEGVPVPDEVIESLTATATGRGVADEVLDPLVGD